MAKVRGGQWAVTHAPAAANVATISKPAEAGKRHVCTSIVVRAVTITGGTAGGYLIAHLRDGATGAGTILQSFAIIAPIVGQSDGVALDNLNIVGSPGVAMTLEFAAAGATGVAQSVALGGYTI